MTVRILRGVRRACAALALYAGLAGFVLAPSPALAVGPGNGPGGPGAGGGGGAGPRSVPEIDPGSAAGALLLLAGGTLILVDRVRRPAPPPHAIT